MELTSTYIDSAEAFGTCALSCLNWIDALADHDCFCITLNVGRSQAAIADPTQVIRGYFILSKDMVSIVSSTFTRVAAVVSTR